SRERHEYERAQRKAQRDSEVLQAANTGHRTGDDIPYMLPVHDDGRIERNTPRETYTSGNGHTDYSGYVTDHTTDLGALRPVAEDTRDYPDVAEDVAEQLDEEIAEEESDEDPLGYMLVADGSHPAPKIDEEALKIRKSRKRRRTVVML